MSTLVNLSDTYLAQSIGDNFAEAMHFMHARQHSSTWYAEARVERAESDVNMGWYNAVIVHPESGNQASVEELSTIRDSYRNRNKRAMWFVCAPGDLTDLSTTLQACDLKALGQVSGMAIDLQELSEDWTLPQGVTAMEAKTTTEIQVWNDVLCRAYPMPPEMAQLFSGAVDCDAGPATPQMVCYTLLYEGEPAGTVAAFYGREHVGLYVIGTLESVRGKGIGTTATMVPLLEARRRGYRLGVLHATQQGYGVYERIGFKPVIPLTMWMDEAMLPKK